MKCIQNCLQKGVSGPTVSQWNYFPIMATISASLSPLAAFRIMNTIAPWHVALPWQAPHVIRFFLPFRTFTLFLYSPERRRQASIHRRVSRTVSSVEVHKCICTAQILPCCYVMPIDQGLFFFSSASINPKLLPAVIIPSTFHCSRHSRCQA